MKAAGRPARPIVAFSGPSGVGKTTFLVALVGELRRRGVRVAAIKHSGHAHGFDVPGKDSDLLVRAGAEAVAVQGPDRMALFGPPVRGGARALAALLPDVDLILLEGWRSERLPRVEVHRRAISREFACAGARGFVAVVSDEPPPRRLPVFAAGDASGMADFLCERFLPGRGRRGGGRGRPRRATSM